MENEDFREIVWQKGRELYRSMPWRDEPTLYYVLVSEIMLQQTQVERVRAKFAEFIQTFPDFKALATADLAAVLRVWQGLGYNRRARFLHQAAQAIVEAETAHLTVAELVKLPGVGKNTAGAIMNYVYEVPTSFVETNIRTVYFHHFFQAVFEVSDSELLQLVASTIDHEHPREWFWALMDYGSDLKKKGYGGLNVSKHYKKQTPFKRSLREMRGRIIRELSKEMLNVNDLQQKTDADERFQTALKRLIEEGLIARRGTFYYLP